MALTINGRTPSIHSSAFIAPGAAVMGDVTIAADVSVWYNAVLRGDVERIVIGRGTNIQDCCVVHTDIGLPAIIGDGVTVGHNAILHGCTVGSACLIGMGAILLNGSVIGDDSVVAAGSLVTEGKTFPSGSMIMGSPAKVTRSLTEREIAELRSGPGHYIAYAAMHKDALHAEGIAADAAVALL
jgi:carbonic anhydrase/acetyltransferase-like protein (isoleucine patch superfamily)